MTVLKTSLSMLFENDIVVVKILIFLTAQKLVFLIQMMRG